MYSIILMLIALSFASGKAQCLKKLKINSCFRLLPMYFLYLAEMCVENVCLIWKFHSLMYSHTNFNKKILSNTLSHELKRKSSEILLKSIFAQKANLGSLANDCFLFEVIVSNFWVVSVASSCPFRFLQQYLGQEPQLCILGAVLRSRAFRHVCRAQLRSQ